MMRIAAALFALSGCALVITDGPPKPVPPQGPIQCDVSSGASGADVAIGVLGGLFIGVMYMGLSALGNKCAEDDPSCDDGPTSSQKLRGFAYGALFATPWFLSAYVGSSRASDCRAVKKQTGR